MIEMYPFSMQSTLNAQNLMVQLASRRSFSGRRRLIISSISRACAPLGVELHGVYIRVATVAQGAKSYVVGVKSWPTVVVCEQCEHSITKMIFDHLTNNDHGNGARVLNQI